MIAQPTFEPWPDKRFTSADHLRAGNEDAASRRVGRMVARALGLPIQESLALVPNKPPILAWSSSDFATASWVATGIVVHAPLTPDAGFTLAETAGAGWHRLVSTKIDISATTYRFSVTFRIEGHRQLRLELMDTSLGTYGYVRCDPAELESSHSIEVLDSGIERATDGAFRCWGKMELGKPGAFMGTTLVQGPHNMGAYDGDGSASIVLYGADLYATETIGADRRATGE